MKKIIVTTAMIAITAMGFSQEQKTRSNSLGMNITSLSQMTFKLNYERHFKNYSSLVIAGGIILYEDYDSKKSGANGEIQYRIGTPLSFFFPGGTAYFAPYAGYQYVDYYRENNSYGYYYDEEPAGSNNTEYSNFTGGCLFGVRTKLSARFFVDINIGGGFRYELTDEKMETMSLGTQSLGYSGIYPRSNVVLGINF